MPHFHDPYRPKASQNLDGESEPKQAKAPDPFADVPSGTSKEVLAWVDGDTEKARLALGKEQKDDRPRTGLVKELNEIISKDSSN